MIFVDQECVSVSASATHPRNALELQLITYQVQVIAGEDLPYTADCRMHSSGIMYAGCCS